MKVKVKKCRHCKKEFLPTNSLQSVCGYYCAIAITKSKTAEQIDDELWQYRKKELKEEIKTLSDYAKKLQVECNKLARLVDNGQRCISSGLVAKKANGGHFWSSGGHKSITFNLHNIHLQSEYDNTYRHGNLTGYREGLIKRYGQEYFDYVESLPQLYPKLKPSKEELQEATKIARKLVREMEKECKMYSPEEAIKKRTSINEALGFYF